MGLLGIIDHLLGAKPAKSSSVVQHPSISDGGRTLLGLAPATSDGIIPKVYAPPQPSIVRVVPNTKAPLQLFGDAQGNRWLEDEAGNRFQMPVAKQPLDSRLNSSFHDPLRPGQTTRTPTSDGVFRPNPLLGGLRMRNI